MVKLKTIKISEEGYRKLNTYAGVLRAKEKKPVSINETLLALLSETEKNRILDFAGSWKMTDKEAEKIKKSLKKLWSTWKTG